MITLINADCLEEMKSIPDQSIDMILCDLPYGTTRCSWDIIIPFEPLWEQYKRIIKDRGAIALFGSEPFSSCLRLSNISMFKYDLIWEKSRGSNFVHSHYQPLKVHEIISIFSKSSAAQGSKVSMNFYPQMTKGKPYNKGNNNKKIETLQGGNTEYAHENKSGDRKPRSVIYYATADSEGKPFHPSQKPIALLEYLLRTYSLEGDMVLDNTMGSGSTGVACINTGRNFIGIEKDKKYFDIAQERINKAESIKKPSN